MEQTITTSVNDLAQAFSIAFRQEFQPLKQELQILAANSTSQHLDNGTALEPELTRRNQYTMSSKQQFRVTLPDGRKVFATGDTVDGAFSSFAKKVRAFVSAGRTDARKEGVPDTQRVYKKRLPPFFYGELETDNKEKLRVCSEGVCHAVSG